VEGHGHIDTTRLNAQAAALVLKRHAVRVGSCRTICHESELEETADSYNSQEDGKTNTQTTAHASASAARAQRSVAQETTKQNRFLRNIMMDGQLHRSRGISNSKDCAGVP
jgi:hypothetical protein